jgi:hypothetical protein
MALKNASPVDGGRTPGLGTRVAAIAVCEQGTELCMLHAINGRVITQGVHLYVPRAVAQYPFLNMVPAHDGQGAMTAALLSFTVVPHFKQVSVPALVISPLL